MTERWFYSPGNHYVLDDLSGFKIRRDKARIIPGGQTGQALVARTRWEAQQPQDFVRGVIDDQTVDLARPRQQNQFTVTATFVISPSGRGSVQIQVDSSLGFSVGDQIQIMLDEGENLIATVISITGNVISFSPPLSGSVGMIGDPIENMVMQRSMAGALPQFIGEESGAILVTEGLIPIVMEAAI